MITLYEYSRISESEGLRNGFWSGDAGASGILPISKSGNICLGWRSDYVHMGNCWGIFGGAVKENHSPKHSAVLELAEETGYVGPIELHEAYLFKHGSFRYQNYIGVVPREFPFAPEEHHEWETVKIQWFAYKELQEALKQRSNFHPGLLALFKNSANLIEKFCS